MINTETHDLGWVMHPVWCLQQLTRYELKDSACCRINGSAFSNDKSFQNVLNTAFEHFINLSARAPEYISLFMDDQLRKVDSPPASLASNRRYVQRGDIVS